MKVKAPFVLFNVQGRRLSLRILRINHRGETYRTQSGVIYKGRDGQVRFTTRRGYFLNKQNTFEIAKGLNT